MAENIPVSTLQDELIECPKCMHQFDDTTRIPRRMPCCVQSICQSCLETCSRRQIVSCPLCRHQHFLPNGVKSLPKESIILKILDHRQIQKRIRLSCTDCPEGSPALAQCDNCGTFLCRRCMEAHVRNSATKNHTTVTMDEVRSRPVESFRRLHKCTNHQQRSEFYCMTCNKVICVSCTVVEHDKGKGHKVVSLDEAHKHKAQMADDVLKKLDKKVMKLNQSVEDLKKKKHNTDLSKQRAKKDINSVFDGIIKQVQQRRSNLLSEVDSMSNTKLQRTQQSLESTQTLLVKVRSSSEHARKMRSKADKTEDLQFMSTVSGSLAALMEEASQNVEFDRTWASFAPANVRQLTSNINVVGFLRTVTIANEGYEEGIKIEPAVFPKVPDVDKTVLKTGSEISYPHLEWDSATAADGIKISGPVVTNTRQLLSLADTGCRLSHNTALASSPLMINDGQRVMFRMKIKFCIKNANSTGNNVLSLALTHSPVPDISSIIGRKGLRVFITPCTTHQQQLCLHVTYDRNLLTDIPLTRNQAWLSHDAHLCFLLDGNNKKIHVIDVVALRVITSVNSISFTRPLWIMLKTDSDLWSDVSCELVCGPDVRVSQDLTGLLSTCH